MADGDDARLKQFEVLWSEVARRSNAQQALLALNVTAVGTVGGLVISGKPTVLLVLLAIVSPVLGLLWVDHAHNIGEIGGFIATNWEWHPNWERKSAAFKRGARGRFWLFAVALTVTFLGPAIVGIVAASERVHGATQIIAFVFASILTLAYGISWLLQIERSRPSGATDG